MGFTILRVAVVGFAGFVFFHHLRGAVRTFSVVKGTRPPIQVHLFPLAILVILYQATRAPFHLWLAIPGLLGLAASLALFARARAAVRGKFFSYAYSDDPPRFLMKTGPYAYVRNPFYSSYLLSYLAAAILFPGVATLLVFVGMAWFLTAAARQEERKFATSDLAAEYESYRQQTGRFIPKLRFRSSNQDFGVPN